MKFLFLYTELADYFLSCIRFLSDRADVEVHVIHWPVNPEAPFKFYFPEKVKFYNRQGLSLQQLLDLTENISPNTIFCSGWIDKDYLKICKRLKGTIPIILGLDNHWKGTLKQYMAVALSPFSIQNSFSHAFVPGEQQVQYAKKLGFSKNKILTGFYSADYEVFHKYFQKCKDKKKQNFPHRLIYVGRYVENKGIKDLWKAFLELQEEYPNDWELWCLGAGPLTNEAVVHHQIKHFGFVQPNEMERFIAETSVFVLPSHFEPWGVVVHEFASAGFPLILSNEVGAATQFLKPGINGFNFSSSNTEHLKKALKKIISMSDEKILEMGENSIDLAKEITPEKWVEKLLSVEN
jgi:glycosyltransferase involved in cell wall biosynthesis